MSFDANDVTRACDVCGLEAFEPKMCEQCANPEPYPDGSPSATPCKDRLCTGCRSECADCKDVCCDYHKDSEQATCYRCQRADRGVEMNADNSGPTMAEAHLAAWEEKQRLRRSGQ